MIPGNPIADLLLAPLPPQWTVEQLADELLAAIAARPPTREFVFGGEAVTERRAQRLLRPLLACLATKSAAETGTAINLYGGRLLFETRCRRDLKKSDVFHQSAQLVDLIGNGALLDG